MARTNESDFRDEDAERGKESSDEQNSEEEIIMSDSLREEGSSEDEEVLEWNDEFRPVERDPAANIRPYVHLFPGFTVAELLSLMPITFKSFIESTRDPCSSCTCPPQNPGELFRFLESWRNRFPASYGNVGSTSSSTQRTHHSRNPQNQVPNAGNQTTDEKESSGDQAASKGKQN